MFLIAITISIIAAVSFSIALTGLIFIEFEEGTEKTIRKQKKSFFYILLCSLLLAGIAFYFFHEDLKDIRKKNAEQQKNATYYAVTEETVNQIEAHCKEKHVKYSTQQSCKSRIKNSLKVGKDSDGFTSSDVIVKPSGVAPH